MAKTIKNPSKKETENKSAEERIKHLASFPQLNPNPVIELDSAGNVTFANPASARVMEGLGIGNADIRSLLPEDMDGILRTWDRKREESIYREVSVKDRIFAESIYLTPQFNVARIYVFDITMRKQAEEERETTVEFLRIVNKSHDTKELIHAATAFFQERSGCEAVGIRLHDKCDYPYFETRGFSNEFVQMESRLCSCDNEGNTILDDSGNPVLACMCGNVIRGRFDPSKPFFTTRGSFWSNCTTDLLASTTDADRQARTRNRCNGEGYESVALISLTLGSERLGLLQLNDRRKGRFTAESINLWERLSDYLAVALAKFRSDEALTQSKSELEAIFNSITDAAIFTDAERRVVMINPAVSRVFGYTTSEVKGRSTEIFYPDRQAFEDAGKNVYLTTNPLDKTTFDIQYRRKDGSIFFAETTGTKVVNSTGNIIGLIGIHRDITERKQAEVALRRAHEELEERVRVRTSELSGLNDDLEAEIDERRMAENRLSRINSLYSILSRVNEAIVRIHNPETLFEQTCRIVVDSGLFKMSWIGLVNPQTAKVEPIASAGDSGKYLERITIIARKVPEGRGPTGSAIVEGKAVICPDIENDPAMRPWKDAALREGFRSSASFPLRTGSAIIGSFTAYADSPSFFTDEEIRLLSSLAEDISFAIESMAMEKRRIEAEQTVLASAGEIKDLYNNAPCGYHSLDKNGVIIQINDTELSWMGYGRDKVIGRKISDFYTKESKKIFSSNFPNFLRTGRAVDLEFELIRRDGTVMPVSVNATAIRDKDNNFVMSRSTVFDITERKVRERETQAANNVLKLFSATAERSDYLNALISLVKTWCGCSSVGIRLISDEGDIPFAAHSGFSEDFIEQESCLTPGKDSCACTRVIMEKPRKAETSLMSRGGSFVCNDTSDLCSKSLRTLYRHACMREGFSSLAIVPVRYRDEVIGAIHLADPQKNAFPARSIDFIENLTPLIGEALHRFSIEEELTASREELRSLTAHLQAMREEERIKIAREIHDELGQVLTAAGMELALLKNRYKDQAPIKKAASSVIGLLDNAVSDIQRICEELRPRVLDHLGLPVAIKHEAAALTKRTGIRCSIDLGSHVPILTDASAVALFRIFQEALTNVARHSRATELSVRLTADKSTIILDVMDNGKGISRQDILNRTSLGLIGMRERARDVGGEVTFSGDAGKGTTITVKIPMKKNRGKRGDHV